MSRPVQGLDPMPSPAELLRIRDERLARRPDLAHLREPVAHSPTSSEVEKRATGAARNKPAGGQQTRALSTNRAENPTATTPAIAERHGDTLRLVLHVAPRTKKNSKQHYTRQSKGYVRYRERVKELLEPIVPALQLPLPDQHYNIAAVYYVDRRGEPADKVGLDQGLYDALQDAGVVSDDWYFRTADGTRVVFGDPLPRVELLITPHPATP